jgi:hypothetical protein
VIRSNTRSPHDPPPAPPWRDVFTPAPGQVSAVGAGTGVAIFTVVLFELHTGVKLGNLEACAVGSVGATVFGYAWTVFTRVLNKLVDRI